MPANYGIRAASAPPAKKKSKRRILGAKMLIAGGLLLILVLLIDIFMRPTVETIILHQAKLLAVQTINHAFYEEIERSAPSYQELVHLVYDDQQNVRAIENDMAMLNITKERITQAIIKSLGEMENQPVKIPVGTLSGITLLAGRGPDITLHAVPSGYVTTQILSTFESAGINQTRHELRLSVTVTISAIIPGFLKSTECSLDFMLGDTVIVGEIPDHYTHIVVSGQEPVLQMPEEK
ncbi:MAG TPA: sporulation protein YunB [Firmicutes bacterium]|nr:sporulation protein YunB [Bacillota bacterium]